MFFVGALPPPGARHRHRAELAPRTPPPLSPEGERGLLVQGLRPCTPSGATLRSPRTQGACKVQNVRAF